MPDAAHQSALAGKTVLVTRAREQSSGVCRALEAHGARPLVVPMVRFALPEDTGPMDRALHRLHQFDWWLLTSQNAVLFAAQRARALGIELRRASGPVRIAALGAATAAAADANGLAVHYTAQTASGESLANELAGKVAGKRVLLLRSDLADDRLPARLGAQGAKLTEAVAYSTLPAPEAAALLTLEWKSLSAAIFFSPSAVRYFLQAFGMERAHAVCDAMPLVAMGPTTEEAIREAGFPCVFRADAVTSAAAVDILERHIADGHARCVAKAEQP